MITELRIGNARIFEGEDWQFPISPLTILCGGNSAGKSTVLRCLLLLRQALLSREGSPNQEGRARLRFTGGLIDLGNFRSFISHNDVDRDLQLGITISAAMDASGLLPPSGQLDLLSEGIQPTLDPQYVPYELVADFRFGLQRVADDGPVSSIDAAVQRPTEGDEPKSSDSHPMLKEASFRIVHSGVALLNFKVVAESRSMSSGIGYLLRLPRNYLDSLPELESLDFEVEPGSDYVELRAAMRGILPERIVARSKIDDSAPARYWPLPSHVEEVLQDLRSSLFRMSYLGPLRAPAQRYYTGQGDSNVDSDVSGESLPYILRDRLEDPVFNATPIDHVAERVPLSAALNTWLYFLRTGIAPPFSEQCAGELSVSSIHDVLVSLGIRSASGLESHALADSGFGYSQVLPILVKGLMIARGALLIVEQPEVHLNPALQVRLSDFFVAMASRNKQMLLETHSEHIVNTVRAVAAESVERTGVDDDYSIIYLESQQTIPTVHRMSILSDGTVPDWPSSFFGESSQLLGRLLRAQTKLRK